MRNASIILGLIFILQVTISAQNSKMDSLRLNSYNYPLLKEYAEHGTPIKSHHYGLASAPYIQKGDTIDLNFYPEFPKDNILVEWRVRPNDSMRFYFSKVVRIKNNFSHDIYLASVKTGAGYCVPGGLYSGIIKPGEEAYSSISLSLDGKERVSRGVGFNFIYCPGTAGAEFRLIEVYFKGKRFSEEEKEKEKK